MLAAQKLGRLLTVLHSGETLAADVAGHQATLAPVPWMRRALRVQATQERQHAAFAQTAALMSGASDCAPDLMTPLRKRLQQDLAAGRLSASLCGLQGVVEHMGEALLEQLGQYPHPAGVVLHKLRRHVLAQEHGHVLLGARCKAELGELGAQHSSDGEIFDQYCVLGRTAAMDVATLLDDTKFDASAFWNTVQSRLVSWHA